MSFIIIFLLVVVSLFFAVFLTKRRFGVLGLALAAGAMLSTIWVGDLTPIIVEAGFMLVRPPLESVVAAALILIPAVLLLFSGPTYKNVWQRCVGSAAFAVLAIALLLEPLGSALVIEGPGEGVYHFFVQYRTILITAGLVMAVTDVLFTRTPRFSKGNKH